MQTTFTYGLIMAVAGALLNYAMYFLGYHDSIEKVQTSQTIGSVGGFGIGLVCLILAVRARRAETPANEGFSYGRSFLAGFLTALWSTILGTISHVIYITVVNPDFREIMIQGELAKVEAKGVPVDQAEGMIRMMMGPIPQAIMVFLFLTVIWTVVSLIIAALIRRPESQTQGTA